MVFCGMLTDIVGPIFSNKRLWKFVVTVAGDMRRANDARRIQ